MNATCNKCGRPEDLAEPFIDGVCVECVKRQSQPIVDKKRPPLFSIAPTPTLIGMSLIALSTSGCAVAALIQTVHNAMKYGIGRGIDPYASPYEWELVGALVLLFVIGASIIAAERLKSVRLASFPTVLVTGWSLVLCGAVVSLWFLFVYQTAVDGYHNIGLQQNRTLGFASGAVLAVIGVLVVFMDRLRKR